MGPVPYKTLPLEGTTLFAIPTHRLCVLVVAACWALSACSTLENEKIDYKSASKGVALEVPPDLTQLSRDGRYQVPSSGASVGPANKVIASGQVPTAAVMVGDARIERNGNQRWLVVKRSPEVLWSALRDFWTSNGFVLTTDEPGLGVMETDWAENRAKLPQDLIRSSLGKIFDQIYSTGERDRFRTRLERLPSGETEIYISHRGLAERLVVANAEQSSSTRWVVRGPDPELEAEFLRRMLVRLGVSNDQSSAMLNAATPTRPGLAVQLSGSQATLTIPEKFDVAWRRVGLALDRAAFTVVDRDRNQGVYFVRYAPPTSDAKEPGLLTKLFSSSGSNNPVRQYRVRVVGAQDQSVVTVQDDQGAPANVADAQKILNLLAQDLR